jgi:hypothetical protein
MRPRSLFLFVSLSALTLTPALATSQTPARSLLEGVWDYTGPRPGRSIFLANTFIMFRTQPDSSATSTPPSEADQARLYRTMMLQSGTFAVTDSIVTMNQTYGKNPRQRPTTWRWSYTLRGDTLYWRVLNAQGQVTESGTSVRAR